MRADWRRRARRAISFVAAAALLAGVLQVLVAPAASAAPIFTDDFASGNFANWTSVTRLTIDNANGAPATPSARAQVTSQSAFAYRTLGSMYSQVCMSANVNVSAGTALDLLRLRTASNGPVIKVFVSSGTLRLRSDFGATNTNSGVALGTGWHNVELCGTVGTGSTWDLYRDGVRIINAWVADTGTTPVGRIQIGDTAAKTFTVNFDHVVLDQAPGDEGAGPDVTPPTTPGQPTESSSSTNSIQIQWTASTDASPPITYRVYRNGNATPIGSTTETSFTDTGLAAGSSHTYRVDAADALNNVSPMSPASALITVQSSPGGQPVPGHTTLPVDTPRTDVPRIMNGDITDLEVIGNRIFIAGTFTSIQNNTANNTTTYNQRWLASYNMDTGLVDTGFRPTFDRGIVEIEATPDGSKLFVVGRFNSVNGVTRRKVVALNPNTGAVITSFTANADSRVESVEASNTTVYIGGDFTMVNGTPRQTLAAVNATTGQVLSSFVNNISGGIGVDGRLTVQALTLTHDESKLLVVHTGRQINGQDRYGVGLIDTQTNQLLPWRSTLWQDNLAFVGGVQRIVAGAIAPNDEYFVVSSGSGGDRPPISDTAIAFPIEGGDGVEPLWISRCFDSVYSVAISEVAVYVGGHMNFIESPTAPDPWPGLDDVGYGWGQGIAGYGLGDDIVTREHIAALDPATGKSLEWNPGSNSQYGNQAMLVTPRGLITGGDGNLQGGQTVGRVAFYDFNSVQPEPNESKILSPIEGRVEEADVEFLVEGTASATSGVRRVELQVIERGTTRRWLQDDLTTWSTAWNSIIVNLASPDATFTTWSLPLTISGNRLLQLQTRTFAVNGSRENILDIQKIETFGLADATPTTSITGPGGSVIPTMTFTATGTATDDVGVNSITFTLQDAQNRYLQDDGTVAAIYNAFRGTPDVVGATNATWSWEWTVPFEGEWKMQATAVDTAGQPDLRSAARTWLVSENAIAPSVAITTPVVMNPPTAALPLTMAPGSPVTFSGSASDDENLKSVEISLRNTVTRENLASDGTWGTDVVAGWYRVSPLNLNSASYNWSYTTPFNLRPGTYTFSVRATDDLDLTTSSTYQGRLTINVQVPGDNPPTVSITPTGTQPNLSALHLDLAGSAADDFGVVAVRVTIRDRDTNRYVQPNGTLSSAYALLTATMTNPGATSTAWALSVDLPAQGEYDVTAFAFDASDQQNLSTTGATARYPAYPGDMPPAFVDGLFSPAEGAVFTDAKIFVSGRVEDDQQIAQVQVAIRDSLGRYMSSSGTFTSTSISWRTAYLNSPGSSGSNFAYTSPAIPAGNYTVFARGVDQHGFATDPPIERNVVVQVPPNDPPVASFTYTCVENVCSFDGRSSTDENAPTLVYSWNFGNGTGSGPVPTRTYTSASTYTVTLTVRDEYGVTGSTSQQVTIVEPGANVAPTPIISTPSCSGLVCNFSSVQSTDPNPGDTFTRVWNWGDGTANSTSTSPSHTFPAPGTYTVTLTVTDGWGKSASTTLNVSVA